jgi:hypothetical protein
MKVKVFGERNCGTRAAIRMITDAKGVDHYAPPALDAHTESAFVHWSGLIETAHDGPWRRMYRETLLDMRYAARGALGAWKHAAPIYEDDYRREGVNVLFMVRNPYSWILALHRRPYHDLAQRHVGFDIFLRRVWHALGRDGVEPFLRTPLMLWNRKLAAYTRFAHMAHGQNLRTAFLRFENFVDAPQIALMQTLRELGAAPGALAPLHPTKPMGRSARERKHYYGCEAWRADLCAEDVAYINTIIDWDLASLFGYARLNPSEFSNELLRGAGSAAAA